MDENEYEVLMHFQITSWPETAKYADTLMKLAEEHTKEEKILSASAAVVMATTLEHAIWAKLAYARACAKEVGYDDKALFKLINNSSLWMRVRELPNLLTNGKRQLNIHVPYTKVLFDLITFRNSVLHTQDGAKTIRLSADEVKKMKREGVMVAHFGAGDLPKNPWNCVRLRQARKFKAAVDVYIREVINPVLDEIEPGEIIK